MAETAASATDEFVEATKPPAVDEKTGVAMDGAYPANHRLRAEALAAAGETTDPLGYVTPELIASTADRVAAETKAAAAIEDEAAKAARELRAMTLPKLRDVATAEAVAINGDANKAAIVDAIETARAAKGEG